MTGLQIYKMAMAKLYEDSGMKPKDQAYSVSFLNQMMAEAWRVENSIRESEGRERLETIPFIEDLSAEIPYSDELTRSAFVSGIAAHVYANELETYRAEVCRAEYRQALKDCERGVWAQL